MSPVNPCQVWTLGAPVVLASLMAQDVTVMSPEDPTNLSTFALAEVADLSGLPSTVTQPARRLHLRRHQLLVRPGGHELLLSAQLDDAAAWLAPPAGLSLPAVQRSER